MEKTKNFNSNNCQNCGDFLIPFIGGTRCDICNYKYCSDCIYSSSEINIKKNISKACFSCLSILQLSILSDSEKEEAINKEINMIDQSTFDRLCNDATDLISRNPLEDFIIIKKISGGGFGEVYEIVQKETQKRLAAKVMVPENDQERNLIINEYVLTKLSTHPNVINYYLIYEYKSNIWIIQELMDTSLFSILSRYNPLPQHAIAYILREILNGLEFIHSQYRVHRDIKSDNILISKNGDVKICDLGYAAQLISEKQSRSTLAGTPCWIAPEIIQSKPYDIKVDIWSLGVLAIELAESEPPMIRANINFVLSNTINNGVGLKYPESASNEIRSFISSCLNPDPKFRKSATELMLEPLFDNVISRENYEYFIKERIGNKNKLL